MAKYWRYYDKMDVIIMVYGDDIDDEGKIVILCPTAQEKKHSI